MLVWGWPVGLSTQRNHRPACALTQRPATSSWRAASPLALLFYGKEMRHRGPGLTLPPRGMASSRKENNSCKNKVPWGWLWGEGGRDPFPTDPPAQHAQGLILSARHHDTDSEQPAQKQCYLPPAPAQQPLFPMGSSDWGWLRDPESRGTALLCSPFPCTPTHWGLPALPEGDTAQAGCPGTQERDGQARCLLAAQSRLLCSPQWRGNYISQHSRAGLLHCLHPWPRVSEPPSPALWL